MNTRPCCHGTLREHDRPRPASTWWRGVQITAWIVPGTMLVLMPKCPVCIAMDVALFTGVGISVTSACNLRAALLILCVAALVRLSLKHLGKPASHKIRVIFESAQVRRAPGNAREQERSPIVNSIAC